MIKIQMDKYRAAIESSGISQAFPPSSPEERLSCGGDDEDGLPARSPRGSKGSCISASDGILEWIGEAPRTSADWMWNDPKAAASGLCKDCRRKSKIFAKRFSNWDQIGGSCEYSRTASRAMA